MEGVKGGARASTTMDASRHATRVRIVNPLARSLARRFTPRLISRLGASSVRESHSSVPFSAEKGRDPVETAALRSALVLESRLK